MRVRRTGGLAPVVGDRLAAVFRPELMVAVASETGSRALVRLGKILRNHCRAIDTAARYGGDEFAIVFPEADSDIAARIVNRIHEKMSSDAEAPAVSASAGIAAYPADGDTPEKLLAAADRALYRMKHRGGSSIQNLSRIAACL